MRGRIILIVLMTCGIFLTPKAKAQYKEISTCGTRIRVKTANPVDGWSDANTITGGVF